MLIKTSLLDDMTDLKEETKEQSRNLMNPIENRVSDTSYSLSSYVQNSGTEYSGIRNHIIEEIKNDERLETLSTIFPRKSLVSNKKLM